MPAGVPTHLVALVRRCLDKDPRRRVRDIGEARILLEDALAGKLAPDASRTRPATRTPWGWMAVSAALLLIFAGIFLVGRDAPSNERVLRYSIPLPQGGVTLDYALSPDGRHVAFHSWDLRPLPNTSGATGIFWSPDSRYIGFFAPEKLWKVAVNGVPAEALCDVPGLLGARGTWGRNDVIVFALSNKYEPGPLRSVSAAGGESSPLTAAAPGESHRFPVFLPDGNRFLYTRVGGSNPGIARLDEPSGRRLLADESSAHLAPAPNGRGATHLLFNPRGYTVCRVVEVFVKDVTDGGRALSQTGCWGKREERWRLLLAARDLPAPAGANAELRESKSDSPSSKSPFHLCAGCR